MMAPVDSSGRVGEGADHARLVDTCLYASKHAADASPAITISADFSVSPPITAAELDVIERYFADLIDAALACEK